MVSFPILCFLVLCGFLGCLGLLALAVTKVVAPDGRGHARGIAGGCAAVLALLLLSGLGLAGLAATVGTLALGSVADWNPIRRIEIARTGERSQSSAEGRGAPEGGEKRRARESAVTARVTVRDDGGGALLEFLRDLVDLDRAGRDADPAVHRHARPDGEFSVYEFRLPISERELARFERDLEHELDGLELRLPERVDIEFQGAD